MAQFDCRASTHINRLARLIATAVADWSFRFARKARLTAQRQRYSRKFMVRLATMVAVAVCMTYGSNLSAGLYEDRELYKQALSALQANRISQFENIKTQLGDYPLIPYLDYRRALLRVGRASAEEALAYRDAHSKYSFGERFMKQWLDVQARNGRWRNYVEHYEPTTNVIDQCRYALGLLRTGDKAAAYRVLPELWNVGKSQHKSCDPAFESWINEGGISADLAWERLKKALDGRQYQLSRYIRRFLPAEAKRGGELMYEARRNPSVAGNPSRFPNDRWGNEAWIYSLYSLARTDSKRAYSLWQRHHGVRQIDSIRAAALVSDLYLWLGLDGHIGLPHQEGLSTRALERVIHAAIAKESWQEAARWMNELPEADLARFEWRYWRSRVDQALGKADWFEGLESLASERTYYGFLAAQTLNQPVSLKEQRYVPNAELESRLADDPHVKMVFEFFAVGEPLNGRQEWRRIENSLSDEEKMVMIQWFNAFGLSNEAIWAANRGEALNFLEVRFPKPFLNYFRQGAFVTNVPVEFLLAISRQESAFNYRAISRAGARGLMQLMLTTAQATARNRGLQRPSASALLDPRRNVEIGSHHVAELMTEFDYNRVLVAASYNAGKHNTYRWLREFKVRDATSFIEIIPYRETREYVKGVLAFTVVYAARDGLEPILFGDHEMQLPSYFLN